MTRFIRKFVLLLAMTAIFAQSAHAVLYRVGPNDIPTPPGNGYPFWYQDFNGLALDLCIPANQFQLDNGVCLILPPDQDPAAGMNLPIVFPTNYPDEAFWWNTTGVMDLDPDNRATLVMALEAAFATGPVVPGDQVTFGRLRIIVDAPVGGNYTVTTPFGVKNFPNVAAGPRAITFTSDIGIGATGDFHGALNSDIGPFLVAADAPGGNPLPFVTIGGEQFLADTAAPVFVTGSPTGTNYFEVCVDANGGLDGQGTECMALDQFTVMGKVHAGALGSPLNVGRATYSRNGGLAKVDVFANASAAPNAAQPALTVSDGIDNTVMPPQVMNGPTTLGQFYGQGTPADARSLPASVTVTNTADQPPFSVVQPLVDHVEITRAVYDPATGTLSITATSSDKGDPTAPAIAPPALSVVGLPGSATGSDPLAPVGGIDPAEMTIAYTIPAPLPPGGPVPPATVTVTSGAGGIDVESITFPLEAPLTAVALGAAPPSPQVAGTSVLFTATPTGGAAPVQYEFRGRQAGTTTWSVARAYGPSNTYLWTAVAGNWEIQVNARSAGSVSPAEATATVAYSVTTSAVSAVSLVASPVSPSTPGTSVTFTAVNPVGGVGPIQYEFRGRQTGTTNWIVARAYGPSPSWSWSAVAGSWEIQVNARSAGSVSAAEATATITYVVNNPAVTGITLTASPVGPSAPGTAVTFTASNPVGGTAPLQYEFRGRRVGAAAFGLMKAYSTSNTLNWTAALGSFEIQVNVRSAGSTGAAEATQTITYTVQ